MIFTIFSKIISGAIVGYVTNDLAVQMLFRKKFGLGGIVLKTHDEFVENISKLVEKEVINHETLLPEFQGETFQNALRQTVQNLFEVQIKQGFPENFTLQSFPKVDDFIVNIQSDLAKTTPKSIQNVLRTVGQQLEVGRLVSPKQREAMGESLTKTATAVMPQIALSEWIEDVFEQNKYLKIEELASQELRDVLLVNLEKIATDFYLYFVYNCNNQIEEIIEYTSQKLDLNEYFETISQKVTEKTLLEIVSQKQLHNIVSNIFRQIEQLLESKKGDEIFEELTKFVYEMLSNEKTTLFELLSPALEQNFTNFLQKHLPQVLEKFIFYIQEQKERIDFLIDETFQSNTQFKVQDWLLDLFVGSVSEKAEVVKKIIVFLEKYNADELAIIATKYAIDYLKNHTISEIVMAVPAEKFTQSLHKILKDNLLEIVKNAPNTILDSFLDKKIVDFVSQKEVNAFFGKMWKSILENDIKTAFTKSENIKNWAVAQLKNQVEKLYYSNLSALLDAPMISKTAIDIEKQFLSFVQNTDNQGKISTFIESNLEKQLNHKTFIELASDEQLKKIAEKVYKIAIESLQNQYENIKNQPLAKYWQRIEGSAFMQEKVATYLHKTVLEQLESALKGRVEGIVKQNLKPLPPENIRDMVEKFMGKELAPINALGAILGGAAGGILHFLPQSEQLAVNLGINSLTYGTVGYGTNWLALEMIFKPYTAKKVAGVKVPFTPGVVVKNRRRFAENMGKFVENSLLNKESILKNFDKNITELQLGLNGFVKQNNYEILQQLSTQNAEKLAQFIESQAITIIEDKRETLLEIVENALENSRNFTLKDLDTDALKIKLSENFNSDFLVAQLNEKIVLYIEKHLEKHTHLTELLPAVSQEYVGKNIAKFLNKSLQQIHLFFDPSTQRLENTLGGFYDGFYQKYTPLKVKEWFSEEKMERLKKRFEEFTTEQLTNDRTKSKVLGVLVRRLESEINPQKPIKDILNGKLVHFIEQNTSEIIEKLIEQGVEWLRKNKKELAEEVYEKAFSSNPAAFIYKTAIRETVYDLADEGIPRFFKLKKPEFTSLVNREVSAIGELPIGDIQVEINLEYLETLVYKFLGNKELHKTLHYVSNIVLEHSFFENKVSDFENDSKFLSKESILEILRPELKATRQHFALVGSAKNLQDISENISKKIEKPAFEFFKTISLQNVLQGVPMLHLGESSEKILQRLLNSPIFEQKKMLFLDTLFSKIKSKPLEQHIDFELFKKEALTVFEEIITLDTFQKTISDELRAVLMPLLERLNEHIPAETKDFCLDILSRSVFRTLQANLPTLLGSIDFHKVVVMQIQEMHPKEIEALFNSFAGKYFKQLINYGFGFGIVFGLAVDFILTFSLQQLNIK